MTEALFALEPDNGEWTGPFLSSYGAHLAMVVKRKDARYPALEEVRGRVEADLTRQRQKELSEKAIAAIVDTYKVEIDLKDDWGRNLSRLRKEN